MFLGASAPPILITISTWERAADSLTPGILYQGHGEDEEVLGFVVHLLCPVVPSDSTTPWFPWVSRKFALRDFELNMIGAFLRNHQRRISLKQCQKLPHWADGFLASESFLEFMVNDLWLLLFSWCFPCQVISIALWDQSICFSASRQRDSEVLKKTSRPISEPRSAIWNVGADDW